MNEELPRGGGGWSLLQSTRFALLLIILQPLIVKAPLLLGILKSNPLLKYSGLASGTYVGMPGVTTIDPNIAYTSHALGGYAAKALFSGNQLWWNPYEGIGMPLAGEMQSAAFFPPTWLLALPNGQLLEHLLLQIIAGIATFFFARRLNASVLASWFAGTLFSFNGAYAWLANAAVNPICFLPVVLLGVELVRSDVARERVTSCLCVSLGLTASLYSGFPETAYLDGLMIAGWVLVRSFTLFSDFRLRIGFLVRTGLLALCGCLIAMPLLVAFADYLIVANIGLHGSQGIANALRPAYAAMFLLPYLSGALSHSPLDFWGGIGGYAGMLLAILALAGAVDGPRRAVRIYLAAWVIVGVGVIFGVTPFIAVLRLIPGLSSAALYRYVEPSVLFALAILAALFIDDLMSGDLVLKRLRLSLIAVLVVGVVLAAVAVASGARPLAAIEYLPLIAHGGLIALFTLVVFLKGMHRRRRGPLIALLVALEAVALFMVPMVSYPLKRDLHVGSVAFLQRNLGNQRFVSAGPISTPGVLAANYGSFFGIGQVNWNDLPVPQRWIDYVSRHLAQDGDAIVFRVSPQQVAADLAAYAALGTKYVSLARGETIDNLRQVYADEITKIYEVPAFRPYFTAPNCAVTSTDRVSVTTVCAQPSQVRRLELFMDGWAAQVDGRSAKISPFEGAFQMVNVPAGKATTVFAFKPPYLPIGQLLALVGVVILAAVMWFSRARSDRSVGERAF